MISSSIHPLSVGIIGSFKQHYPKIYGVVRALHELGLQVTTPKGSHILEEGIDFVRFDTDFPSYDDPTIQSITLHRLLEANFVYVVAPRGYIGRTTCYEIGRLFHACMPVYFSAPPKDLPITLPESHILPLNQLILKIENQDFVPSWPFLDTDLGFLAELEREIALGKYRKI